MGPAVAVFEWKMLEEDREEKTNKKTAKRTQDHREKQQGEKDKDEILATVVLVYIIHSLIWSH